MKKLLNITFSLSVIIILLLGFALPVNPPVGNWYQQFMPDLGGRSITDITFTDSLKGFAITNEVSDTSFVIRTTNGGNNWTRSHFDTGICSYYNIQFVNQNTGYVSGYIYNGSVFRLVKTTNGGNSWFYINHSSDIVAIDMHALSEDTIWVVDSGSLTGGVFFTSNGGTSWQNQLSIGSQNPTKIYMFNSRIGFISKNLGSQGYVRKTENGGASWSIIVPNDYYLDIYFADSLLGWKSSAFGFKKTTDGGLNWVTQTLPSGGLIQTNGGLSFSNINRDTIWSSGGYLLYPNNTTHGFLNRTTNQGDTWYYQIPDTSLLYVGGNVNFVNKLYGWATSTYGGIHTTTGGDPVWYFGIQQISNNIPKDFELHQNYPNPFNPRTVIPFSLKKSAYVKLIAYDITGREVQKMVDGNYSAGEYEVDFMGKFTASGVYLYRMEAEEHGGSKFVETKKMILLK